MGILDLLSGLLDSLKQIGAAIVSAIAYTWGLLSAAVGVLWRGLQAVVGAVKAAVTAAAKAVRALGGLKLGALLQRIQGLYLKLKQWLHTVLDPVIKILKAQRAYLNNLFNLYMRPILNAIQNMRKFIAILRLMHIHTFDGLDKTLAGWQAAITAALLKQVQQLNTMLQLLELVLDPLGLFSPATLLGSLAKSISNVINLAATVLKDHSSPATASPYASYSGGLNGPAVPELMQRLQTGQLNQDDLQWLAYVDQQWEASLNV